VGRGWEEKKVEGCGWGYGWRGRGMVVVLGERIKMVDGSVDES
jgi:hypothetical protein